MALRTIVQDGDPILKKVCRPVTKFDDRLGTLLDDMKEDPAGRERPGSAGPQVGMMRRLFICLDDRDLPEEVPANYEYKFIEFINPRDPRAERRAGRGCTRAACPSRDITARSSARSTSRSRHRTATASGLNWRPMTCSPAASSMRTTIWTASPSWTWPSISMRTTTPRKTRTKIYAHPVYGNS